jgi:hypothetical protein
MMQQAIVAPSAGLIAAAAINRAPQAQDVAQGRTARISRAARSPERSAPWTVEG